MSKFIDSIEVKSPCSENWDEMKGGDKMRFCSHCAKSVNNISALTRKQAMRVVRGANGKICVRYIKNPKTNQPIFAARLYQISRRTGIAAGVLGASLSLSAMTYAQETDMDVVVVTKQETTDSVQAQKQSENDTKEITANAISGTITDPNGAIVPNASITLAGDNYTATTRSNEDGFYKFENLPAGKYSIKIESIFGFSEMSLDGILVINGKETVADGKLSLNGTEVVVGGGSFVEYATPLARAVSDEDIDEVRNLIARGENVNGKDENYDDITPLFVAVENGNLEIVETLLSFGAKVNAKDKNKQTPLMRLDDDATAELVRVLIKHGVKINSVDNEGNTALIYAARYVKAPVLQILLDHSANVNAQNKEGWTALMNAVYSDNLEAVRTLILAGANINLKNEDGDTALDLAGEGEIEQLLKSHGAIESITN